MMQCVSHVQIQYTDYILSETSTPFYNLIFGYAVIILKSFL